MEYDIVFLDPNYILEPWRFHTFYLRLNLPQRYGIQEFKQIKKA
jgi:hypothetical protein